MATPPLPADLTSLIQVALFAASSRAEHALLPIHRQRLFRAFASHGRLKTIDWLALAAARKVLPLWLAKRPNDALIPQAIRSGELLLQGRGDIHAARKVANRAWKVLEDLGSKEAGFELGNAFYAATAA